MSKRYRLLKDLPYVKAGAIYEWDDSETYLCNSDAEFTEGTKWDGLGRYAVEKAADGWFEEIKEPQPTPTVFQWTDELVLDAIETLSKRYAYPDEFNGGAWEGIAKEFEKWKQYQASKTNSYDSKNIKEYYDRDSLTKSQPKEENHCLLCNFPIPKEETYCFFHKQPIYPNPQPKEVSNVITPTDIINKLGEEKTGYQKLFTEKELLDAEEKAFKAARENDVNSFSHFDQRPYPLYPTFSDYKNSINPK